MADYLKAPYGEIPLEEWQRREGLAQKRMLDIPDERKRRVLIEVSTQHPLIDGLLPNAEYVARLEEGIRLYRRCLAVGETAEVLVLGSQHVLEGHADKISLAEAGRLYLSGHGVDSHHIRGEDLIERYKGPDSVWPGVYNSSDEAYVAAQYFEDSRFGQLYCVAGPGQLHRKVLTYIWLGLYPMMVSAPVMNPYHSYVDSVAYINGVLSLDPDMQDPRSYFAYLSRNDRKVK